MIDPDYNPHDLWRAKRFLAWAFCPSGVDTVSDHDNFDDAFNLNVTAMIENGLIEGQITQTWHGRYRLWLRTTEKGREFRAQLIAMEKL